MSKFCDPQVKGYERMARDKDDVELREHLEITAELSADRLRDPMWRKWRRVVTAEALRRGLITEDRAGSLL